MVRCIICHHGTEGASICKQCVADRIGGRSGFLAQEAARFILGMTLLSELATDDRANAITAEHDIIYSGFGVVVGSADHLLLNSLGWDPEEDIGAWSWCYEDDAGA